MKIGKNLNERKSQSGITMLGYVLLVLIFVIIGGAISAVFKATEPSWVMPGEDPSILTSTTTTTITTTTSTLETTTTSTTQPVTTTTTSTTTTLP